MCSTGVQRVTSSHLDSEFVAMVKQTLPGGRSSAAERYLQDGRGNNTGFSSRMLWKLSVDESLAGWSHCSVQINHITDPLGDPVVTIDAEFNYVYLLPEFRGQGYVRDFSDTVGSNVGNLLPLHSFDKAYAVLEVGVPLNLVTRALCVHPGGRTGAEAFAESLRDRIWTNSQDTLLVLSDEIENIFTEDYLVA